MIRFGRGAFIGSVCFLLVLAGCKSAVIHTGPVTTAYKRWFLEQIRIGCSDCVVGIAMPSHYQSSSAESALKNACLQYARNQHMLFEGGQAFWSTEAGRIWMGNNFTETFDSSLVAEAMEFLQPVDSMFTESLVAYLFTPNDFEMKASLKQLVSIKTMRQPKWITEIPDNNQYYYAAGVAQESFYEPSAWVEAEDMARKNLAGSVHVTIQSLSKANWEKQEIQNQEISVILQGIEVTARWRDPETTFYHVLIRMPK